MADARGGKRRVYDLEERLIAFAVMVLDIAEELPDTRTGNHIAGQLVRCGTAPAANYGEAQSAESRTDFVHKMKICLKELRETRIWLVMIQRKALVGCGDRLSRAIQECSELAAIFNASIRTAKGNKDA